MLWLRRGGVRPCACRGWGRRLAPPAFSTPLPSQFPLLSLFWEGGGLARGVFVASRAMRGRVPRLNASRGAVLARGFFGRGRLPRRAAACAFEFAPAASPDAAAAAAALVAFLAMSAVEGARRRRALRCGAVEGLRAGARLEPVRGWSRHAAEARTSTLRSGGLVAAGSRRLVRRLACGHCYRQLRLSPAPSTNGSAWVAYTRRFPLGRSVSARSRLLPLGR